MHINRKIEHFLIKFNYPATTFGRHAVNDPRLVHDMRLGRTLGDVTVARIEAFMDSHAKAIAGRLDRLA